MDVRMVGVLDPLATQATIATIHHGGALPDRLLAVQRFGQRAGERFEFIELVADEEIGMGQTPALEGALEQLHALRLGWKIFERHSAFMVAEAEAVDK